MCHKSKKRRAQSRSFCGDCGSLPTRASAAAPWEGDVRGTDYGKVMRGPSHGSLPRSRTPPPDHQPPVVATTHETPRGGAGRGRRHAPRCRIQVVITVCPCLSLPCQRRLLNLSSPPATFRSSTAFGLTSTAASPPHGIVAIYHLFVPPMTCALAWACILPRRLPVGSGKGWLSYSFFV